MRHDFDIGYVKCDPCMDGDHERCLGMDENEPLCGCSMCPWLYWPELGD